MGNHTTERRVLETALTLARNGYSIDAILIYLTQEHGYTWSSVRCIVYGSNTRYKRSDPLRAELRRVLNIKDALLTPLEVAHLMALYAQPIHNSLSACLIMRKAGTQMKDSTARVLLSGQERAKFRLEAVKEKYGVVIEKTPMNWRKVSSDTKRSILHKQDNERWSAEHPQGTIWTEAVIDGSIWKLTAWDPPELLTELHALFARHPFTGTTMTALKALVRGHCKHPGLKSILWKDKPYLIVNAAVGLYPAGKDPLGEARQLPLALERLQDKQGVT